MIIVLDTNFLIYLVKHRIADKIKDFGAKLVVPETVEKELSKPSFGPEEKKFAAAALELIKIWKAIIMPAKLKNVDKSIIGVASELKELGEEVKVATMDEELRGKLRASGIGLITLKRGKILVLE